MAVAGGTWFGCCSRHATAPAATTARFFTAGDAAAAVLAETKFKDSISWLQWANRDPAGDDEDDDDDDDTAVGAGTGGNGSAHHAAWEAAVEQAFKGRSESFGLPGQVRWYARWGRDGSAVVGSDGDSSSAATAYQQAPVHWGSCAKVRAFAGQLYSCLGLSCGFEPY